MKSYWVNVYKNNYVMGAYYRRADAIFWGNLLGGGIGYRLHVREFETKEAKELYLRQKHDNIVKYNKHWNVPTAKYIASRKYTNWMGP